MRKGSRHIRNYRGSPRERFLAKVSKTAGCWLWTGATNYKGYGALRIDGKNVFPHRFSYELYIGNVPEGVFVCHKCDNPSCVNPAHLWLGTNTDNVQDMVKKMRHTIGERNPMAKLTKEQVIKIRKLKDNHSLSQLAKLFGLGVSTVSQIVNRHRWKHI